MANQSAALDQVFRALADPTRRAVLARLGSSAGASVTELAAPFDMALPTFLEHLRTLEAAGLVQTAKTGRVRTVAPVPKALAPAEAWLAAQRAHWEQRLDRLDALLLKRKGEKEKKR
jgi:DNA-binding transcriptional ArsR family regulator